MSVWPANSPSGFSCDKAGTTPAAIREDMVINFRRLVLVFMFQIYFDPAGADAALMYLPANFRKVGQFGASVCPPLCWRKAISPATKAVSIGGKLVVPKSFLPSSVRTGPAAAPPMDIPLSSTEPATC